MEPYLTLLNVYRTFRKAGRDLKNLTEEEAAQMAVVYKLRDYYDGNL